MSTDRVPAPDRTLGEWIRELVEATELDPLGAGPRLRSIVEGWSGRIGLDDEEVVVSMHAGRLRVESAATPRPVDGAGATSSDVVLALLDGGHELGDLIADGRIDAVGHRAAVTRLFHAVEVILDASARVPALRRLAADFRRQRGPGAPLPRRDVDAERVAERRLLDRLGLLEPA